MPKASVVAYRYMVHCPANKMLLLTCNKEKNNESDIWS